MNASEANPGAGCGSGPRLIIIGGGLAGLAAAAALAGRGVHVILLESRPRLGGRASSFTDPASGSEIDNCQHVSMGCCTNLADFCRRVGIAELFRRDSALYFLDPEGRLTRLGVSRLPAPLHLAPGLLRAAFLTLSEKLRLIVGLARLWLEEGVTEPRRYRDMERTAGGGPAVAQRRCVSFAEWLHGHGQTTRAIEWFWRPILTSALNESLERIDPAAARQVFVEGFLRNRRGYVLQIPTVALGELYGTRMEQWLADRGVEVRVGTGVRRISTADERVDGVELRSGETLRGDWYLSAVPFDRLLELLPGGVTERYEYFRRLGELEVSPITGIHLWFDRPVMTLPHVVVLGRTIQWIFNRSQDGGGPAGERGPASVGPPQYLQVVISASRDIAGLGKEEIVSRIVSEIRELFPQAATANVVHARVVTERSATFSVLPGSEALRPPQASPLENLLVAGDWTRTGWPPTMEGAVRSGYLAAELILARLGRAERVVRPGLRAEGLAWWIERLLVRR